MKLRGSPMSLIGLCVAVTAAGGACSNGFPLVRGAGPRITVELKDAAKVTGNRLAPLPLAIGTPQAYRVTMHAIDASGNVDTTFNGWVRMSAKPGALERLDAVPGADGRNVELKAGTSTEVEVKLVNAYGPTVIIADDLGYEPLDPLHDPPPACSNGIDDDGDSKIDYPADEGCAFANDDTETGGTYAQGSSATIFYALPRVADARGLTCVGDVCSGGGATPYPKQPLAIDSGYHEHAGKPPGFDFDLVVTRISSSGFYLSDVRDTRGGFNSVFVFNFSSPPNMRTCDRLKTFAGTASEFFGFTQISYPTWTLEEWDPQKRPCLVPEPRVLTAADLPSPANPDANLLPLTGSLVRVLTAPGGKLEAKVSPKLGPGNVPELGGVFSPTPDASNCDLNKDGKIDFTAGSPEQRCSDACASDPECTEYSSFASRGVFRITVSDATSSAAIQADASTSADFKPLELKGQVLKAFSGTLTYFSGGAQYTIEARCKDDIVVDKSQQPVPSDRACVFPRTTVDENPE